MGQLSSVESRKVVGRPRPLGGDPGAALTGRGWTGRGRGSSPGPGGWAGPARGAARGGGGAASSTRQLRRPGTLDPSPREVKARAARRQLSQVGAEFARRLPGGRGRGGSAAQAGAREASNPRPGVRVLRLGARWIGEPRTRSPPGIRGLTPRTRGGGSSDSDSRNGTCAPGPCRFLPRLPPGLCPITKTGALQLRNPQPATAAGGRRASLS